MDALKLQDQLKLRVKALSEGMKRKVGVGLSVTLRTLQMGATCAVPLIAAVLHAEHPGKPIGGASGRAIHRDGP